MISNFVRNQQSLRWNILFFISIMATLAGGHILWISRVSLVCLAVLFYIDFRFAIAAIFFFASFFYPAGYMLNQPMTIKHFHLVVALAAITQVFNNSLLLHSIKQGLRRSKPLWPLFALILVSILVAYATNAPFKAYKISLNLTLLSLIATYILGILALRPGYLKHGIAFLLLGHCLQIVAAIINSASNLNIYDLHIIHNNHLAAVSTILFFPAITLAINLRHHKTKYYYFGSILMAALILAVIMCACSRTSWFAFMLAFIVFYSLLYKYIRVQSIRNDSAISLGVILFVVSLATLGALYFDYQIFNRFYYLPELLSPERWQYAFKDHENFGFLGKHRLFLLQSLRATIKSHLWFGIGFTEIVIGYHGLYFAILGATGVTGFGLFLYFIASLVHNLRSSIKNESNMNDNILLKIGILSSLTAWMVISLMETLILQFVIWIMFITCTALIYPNGTLRKSLGGAGCYEK